MIMKNNRNLEEDIEQGMELASNQPDIMPDQASEQIRPIYEDIQRTLRVPLVNLIFRRLANYPDYLEYMWQGLAPAFRTKAFETETDILRRKAPFNQIPDTSEINWESLSELEQLRAFNDTIYYVLPKLLLITTVFYEASFDRIKEEGGKHEKENDLSGIPLGVAEGTTKVEMVEPEKASERVRSLFNSIKEKHGYPLVSSYYRGIANWPHFLEEVWDRIKPVVGSAFYEDRKQALVEQALGGIENLPLPTIEKPKLKEEQSSEIKLILSAFQHKFIPEMLLDVALIKAMLDGKEAALSSRFSVAK